MWVIDHESGQDGGMLAKFFLLWFVGQEHLAILTKRAWSIKDLFYGNNGSDYVIAIA